MRKVTIYAILPPMVAHIAVDIGGTQIRAASFLSDSLKPSKIDRISTQAPSTTPLERLATLIKSIWPTEDTVAAIGVAAPGPINPYEGIIYTAPNIPGWNNLPLSKLLQERFDIPVLLGNDANLAALGEWQFGAGRGHHHLIYLTVSTGIGGGIISDDRLLLGVNGLAGELGHITVLPDGPLCGCGARGHLEALASGTAIAHWTEQELALGTPSILPVGQKLTAKQVFEAAQQGDGLAVTAFTRAGTYLGHAIADFLHVYNPSLVIIGGGVSRAGDLLFKPLQIGVRERVISPQYLHDLQITTPVLGDDAGLMGALALAQSLSQKIQV